MPMLDAGMDSGVWRPETEQFEAMMSYCETMPESERSRPTVAALQRGGSRAPSRDERVAPKAFGAK